MPEHDDELILDHTKLLATIDSRSKSNTKRLDNLDKLTASVQELTVGFTRLVVNVEQQSKDLTIMVKTLERHEQKIEGIEEKMETKETVARLHGKVEELQKVIDNREDEQREKKLTEYEDMKKFIAKTLVGAAVFIVGALTIFGTVVLMTLAKTGSLPTP